MNLMSTQQKQGTDRQPTSGVTGGLAVRTNLRAGLAWDDLDDQAKELWSKLTNAVASLTGSSDTQAAGE
jgi:hypothetical protein